ncbi:unnamed protein product [Symbiodinium sp. CCMP2592]|nr:unnamed protein product [Symbiodinium sp. CCMP2592]
MDAQVHMFRSQLDQTQSSGHLSARSSAPTSGGAGRRQKSPGARADAESSYGMFPIGTKDCLGEFPVLNLAKDEEVAKLLLDYGAKPDQRSLVNFFPSGSCLWTATWRSNPLLKLLLRYSKGVDSRQPRMVSRCIATHSGPRARPRMGAGMYWL